ncbi:MAG: imidazole glycerol phosphate synthase subunit HisH [Blastocatellia bacterium]|nr:imidazole glycerol phosphate synthase subunit HisH [Blastocatellia bacterium]
MLAIVDYGVGNLRSLAKAFAQVGVEAVVSSDSGLLADASHLVLPGVGAFGSAVGELRRSNLDQVVLAAAERGIPLLGICVGFQMLFDEGHEFGRHAGLGLLRGQVVRFPESALPIPHVGWNQADQTHPHGLFAGIPDHSFFYFVHSYYVEGVESSDVLAVTDYGVTYPSVCGRNNVLGVQFHPEKSQTLGLHLLQNFASWTGSN